MKTLAITTVLTTLMVLISCGTEESGEPTSNGGTQPTVDAGPTTTAPQVDAPQVPNPIDGLEKHQQDPFAMLTAQQATTIGYTADNRDNGACALTVGVTDEQVINIGGRFHRGSPDRDRPCEVMEEAAEMALQTMSSGR